MRESLEEARDKNKKIWVWVLLVGLITFVTHALNMFGYPYLGGDEGIYISRGWWSVKYGQLTPYLYTYDHSPFGWVQLGLWALLTGGPFTFGGVSVLSARVFMLVLAVGQNMLLFDLIRRMSRSSRLAFAGAAIVAFSPIAIINQRWALLDNVAAFWMVLALWLIWAARSRLILLWISGMIFGWAVLSKEVVAVLIPVVLAIVLYETRKENRWQGALVWGAGAFGILMIYPLMALLRGEFFPASWFGERPHLSLLETLAMQASRGVGKPFWQVGSDFRNALLDWWGDDPIILLIGAWSLVVNLLLGMRKRINLLVALMLASLVLFLIRGGVILGFYIVPLIPVIAMSVVVAIWGIFGVMKWKWEKVDGDNISHNILFVILIIGVGLMWLWPSKKIFFENQTKSQIEAIKYIKKNIEPNRVIVADMYGFLDLRLPTVDGPAFPNVDLFYTVGLDPEFRKKKLDDKWQNIDYILLNVGMFHDFTIGIQPFLYEAYKHSKVVADFPPGPNTYRNIDKLEASDGDWATLMEVDVSFWEKTNVSRLGQLLGPGKVGLEQLSIEEKAGQLIWVNIDSSDVSANYENWAKNGLGGVVLYGKNAEGEQVFKRFAEKLESASSQSRLPVGIMLASDEEGGNTSRLATLGVDDTAQRLIDSPDAAYRVGYERGKRMSELGVKLNLAPVVDVARDEDSFLARQKRGFRGSDMEVAELGRRMFEGLRDGGVVSVVKHFPGGLGRVRTDPHISLPNIKFQISNFKFKINGELPSELKKDLVPFERAIEGGVKAIMVTHLLYPEIDPDYPASLSRVWIDDILRGRLGFSGVVVLDDLAMGGLDRFDDHEKALRFFESGADVVIITGTYEEQRKFFEAMVGLVRSGRVDEERLNESIKRVWRMIN